MRDREEPPAWAGATDPLEEGRQGVTASGPGLRRCSIDANAVHGLDLLPKLVGVVEIAFFFAGMNAATRADCA